MNGANGQWIYNGPGMDEQIAQKSKEAKRPNRCERTFAGASAVENENERDNRDNQNRHHKRNDLAAGENGYEQARKEMNRAGKRARISADTDIGENAHAARKRMEQAEQAAQTKRSGNALAQFRASRA